MTVDNFWNWVYRFYSFVVRFIFACIVSGLLILSLVCICYMETSEYVYLCMDAVTRQALLLLAVLAGAVALGFFARRKKLHWEKTDFLRWGVLVLGGIAGVFWVLNTRYIPRADQLSILEFAEHLRKGEYGVFGAGSYMARYPHQSGIVLVLWGLSMILGDGNYVAFQLLNVAAYVLILWTLGEFAIRLGRKPVLPTFLGFLFLPLLFYTSFLYGTLLGLCFAMLAALQTVDFCRSGKRSCGILAGLSLFAALVIKSNYQIFAIGILIYAVMYLLSHKAWKRWSIVLVLIAAFVAGTKLPIFCMERITGQDFSHGSTTLSWVVMGLHDDGNQSPGRYDGYVWSTLDDAGLDSQLQKERVVQDLKNRLKELAGNPGYAVKLFLKKTASQWCEPIFEGIWILQQMKTDYSVPVWIRNLVSPVGSWQVSGVLNYVHIIILFGAALLAFSGKENITNEDCLLTTIFIGGFLFHTFWEAKGQYTLPYFTLLIPLAIQGYGIAVRAGMKGEKQALLWVMSPLVIVLLTVVAAKVLPLEWLHVDLTRFYHYLGR